MSSSGSLCRHPPKLASNAALDPDDHEIFTMEKIMFFCMNSSTFHWATVTQPGMSDWSVGPIMEVWRSGPGRIITVPKQILNWVWGCAKTRISRAYNEKNMEGTGLPRSRPGRRWTSPPDTPSHTLLPYTLGVCGASILAPSALDLISSLPKAKYAWCNCLLYLLLLAAKVGA